MSGTDRKEIRLDNPFFSIIIPVYKTEKYLRECLDSILRQTCGEFEAIVVDDGSPDGCPEICDSYAAQDSRITVIHKENEGVVKARNTALGLVKGKYLVFVDSDDWIDSDMLEVYRDLIEDNRADMVISGNNYLEFEDKTIPQGYPVHSGRYSKDSLKTLQDNMLYSGTFYEYYLNPAFWGKAYKKELIVPNMLSVDPGISVGEDLCCVYACLLNAENVVVCENKGMYHYRNIQGTGSKAYRGGFYENAVSLFSCMDRLVREKKGEGAIPALDYNKLYAAYMGAAYYLRPGNGLSCRERNRGIRKLLEYDGFRTALNRTEVNTGITFIRKKILTAMREENLFLLYLYIYLEKILVKAGVYMPANGVTV